MKTADEIYREMIETFTRETGMEPDGAGEMAVRMYALAVQVYGLYQEAEWTRRQCFPQTATGEELDKHAWLRGLSRNPASRAVGTLRFSVSTAPETDLPIPQGTVCMTAGLVRFETTQAGVLKAGETAAEVPAQAVLAGPGGNTPAGTIRTMAVAPTGIAACTNPAAFSGGWAEEDDEALRARVLDSYQNQPNGVNEAYYAQQALAVEGVAAVNVVPRARGLGTVDLYITDSGGVPEQGLLEAVRADLAPKREIGVSLQVLAPETVTVNVLVTVKAKAGFSASQVLEAVRADLAAWFDGTMLGKDLLLAQIGQRIYQVEGVENYHIASPANDVTVERGQLPVLGTLAVEELV